MKTQLQKQLENLQNGYNDHQKNVPDFGRYSVEVMRQKTEDYLNTGIETYKRQFSDLIVRIKSLAKVKNSEIIKKKFPLRASSVSNDNILSEQKSMNAKMFFAQFKEDGEMILNELKGSYLEGDLDYMNALLDIYYSTYTSILNRKDLEPVDIEKLQSDSVHAGIEAFRDEFYRENGIDVLNDELTLLNKLALQAESFVEALEQKILILITQEDLAALPDDEYYQLRQKIVDSFGESEFEKIQNYARHGI